MTVPVEPKTQPRMLAIRPRRCACGRMALSAEEYLGMCSPCFVGEAGPRLGEPNMNGHQS